MKGCHIVSERECMDLKEARTATKFNFFPPPLPPTPHQYFFESLFFTERLLRKKSMLSAGRGLNFFVHKGFHQVG